MTCGIEEHAHVFLGLKIGQSLTEPGGVGDSRCQVVDGDVDVDVDVHHHPLVAWGGGPDRRCVVRRVVEAQVGRWARHLYRSTTWILLRYRPPEEAGVEVGQGVCIWRFEHHAPPVSLGTSAHRSMMSL